MQGAKSAPAPFEMCVPAANPHPINANKTNANKTNQTKGKKANTGYLSDDMQEHRRSIDQAAKLRRVQGTESGGSGVII